MAHTFDVRFNRSAGLAALLEAPGNPFRWKGAGFLSIDARGVSITPARGPARLFARPPVRRIDASELTEVYREGNAVRLSFANGAARSNLPIWARDRATAAEIVRLLPTHRTVELEEPVSATHFRVDRRVAIAGLLVAMAALYALWPRDPPTDVAALAPSTAPLSEGALQPSATGTFTAPTPDAMREGPGPMAQPEYPQYPTGTPQARGPRAASPPTSSPAQADASATSPPASTEVAATDGNVAALEIPGPSPSVDEALRHQYELFINRAETLRLAYEDLSRESSRAQLEQLEGRWLELSGSVSKDPIFDVSRNYAMRDLELAISQSWRRVIYMRIAGRGAFTDEQVREEVEFARLLTSRLKGLLD